MANGGTTDIRKVLLAALDGIERGGKKKRAFYHQPRRERE